MEEIKISNLKFSFATPHGRGPLPVIHDFSTTLRAGEITVLLGPSGSGKTTLLNLVSGLIQPDSGLIAYPDDLNEGVRSGYVFQDPNLIPWKTISENALFGAKISGTINHAVRKQCDDWFDRTGLKHFARSYPRALSGGMRQRAAVLRAMLSGAPLLLMDEPFANSDFLLSHELQKQVSEFVDRARVICCLVTHNIEDALRLGDKLLICSRRPLSVLKSIRPDTPRQERINYTSVLTEENTSLLAQEIYEVFRGDQAREETRS